MFIFCFKSELYYFYYLDYILLSLDNPSCLILGKWFYLVQKVWIQDDMKDEFEHPHGMSMDYKSQY